MELQWCSCSSWLEEEDEVPEGETLVDLNYQLMELPVQGNTTSPYIVEGWLTREGTREKGESWPTSAGLGL
jgi:hypothetical protein